MDKNFSLIRRDNKHLISTHRLKDSLVNSHTERNRNLKIENDQLKKELAIIKE